MTRKAAGVLRNLLVGANLPGQVIVGLCGRRAQPLCAQMTRRDLGANTERPADPREQLSRRLDLLIACLGPVGRYFAGLSEEEVAGAPGVSGEDRTADWEKARMLLAAALK